MIEEVMLLQPSYDSKNTPDMQRRGLLIRNEITGYFRDRLPRLQDFVPSVDDLTVHGKDGMGPKNEIPYVRIHSKRLSPRATEGWYVCLLFEALGNEAYLVLAHGSTKNAGAEVGVPEFVEREPHEIAQLMSWATNRLGGHLDGIEGLTETIQMRARRSPLGPAYEKTSLRGFCYDADSVPDDDVILANLESVLGLLDVLYQAEDTDPSVPGKVSDEVAEALEGVTRAAGRKSSGGQGRGLTGPERKAVEDHAMEAAKQYLMANGYPNVEDKRAGSYDFLAFNETSSIKVEVKGTTSAGEKVILTRNEVKLHIEEYPNNALIVLHGIHLERGDPPVATGGQLKVFLPWELDDSTLEPLGYEYPVPLIVLDEETRV
jgi:hypothetical protein